MKKVFFLVLGLTAMLGCFAAVKEPIKASEIFLPVGNHGYQISVLTLSQISIRDFETLNGGKLSLNGKIVFKLAQKKLKKKISPDSSLNDKKLALFFRKTINEKGFHLGGFSLGFWLSSIGVLIAYLINDDKKRRRVKWAWIGFVSSLSIIILIAILMGASLTI